MVNVGKVEKYINGIIDSGKGVFMGLIDPDKQDPQKGLETAKLMYEGGADIILLGGSIGAHGDLLEQTAKLIKENISIPLHIFPGNVSTITKHADSIYFMSLLNSKNPYWITGAQTLGAMIIKQYNVETIPTAYLIFEPGQTVGYVGEANLIPRDKPEIAVSYSKAAEYLGMRFVILESGSGSPTHAPLEAVKGIRGNCNINIVVAGGVKSPEQANDLIKSGANCVHIGTSIENSHNPLDKIKGFAKAIHLEM